MSDIASEPRTGIDHAAIMVMLMSEEDATGILSQLDPDELRQLAARMCALGEIELGNFSVGDLAFELGDAPSQSHVLALHLG